LEAFRQLGQLLADLADPDDIPRTFISSIIVILGYMRTVNLSNGMVGNEDLIAMIRSLLCHPLSVRLSSGQIYWTRSGLGVLFNKPAWKLARLIRRLYLYTALRHAFGVRVRSGHASDVDAKVWAGLMTRDMVVRIWKMERLMCRMNSVTEEDETGEKSDGSLASSLTDTPGSGGNDVPSKPISCHDSSGTL